MCNYDDGQHEFVGMDMCIYCGECKQLLLQTRFDRNGKPLKGLSKFQSTGPEPCDKCKKKFEEDGVFPMRRCIQACRLCPNRPYPHKPASRYAR